MPLCIKKPWAEAPPSRVRMPSAVPGAEALPSAFTPAAKGGGIKNSDRKRAHVQMRETDLQSDAEGRLKPGQRFTESCYSSWSSTVPWLTLSLRHESKLAPRVKLNPPSGHFTYFETGLPTASCSALLCPILLGSLFMTASLRSPENSP